MISKRAVSWGAALALLVGSAGARASTSAQGIERRKQVEAQLARLQAQLAEASAASGSPSAEPRVPDARLLLARSYVDMARRLLRAGNEQSASLMADRAQSVLAAGATATEVRR
jgi:hypothetical protein